MTVSLHLCEEKLAFADGEVARRILDVKKLHPDGLQNFAMANTSSDDFAAGALAMLELLEATIGRPLNVCADSDPKLIASVEDPGGVLAISPELHAAAAATVGDPASPAPTP